MRISYWSSDVCSSDLPHRGRRGERSSRCPVRGRAIRRRRTGPRAAPSLPDARQRLSAGQCPHVPERELRTSMDGKTLARLAAIVFVAVALTATAIEMTREEDVPAAVPSVTPADDTGPLRTELTRCQQLGEIGRATVRTTVTN